MNKKFSTLLTASLLMVGALFSSAQAQTSVDLGDKATEVSSGSMYYIVQQAAVANLAETTDFLMGMSKTGTTLAPLAVAAADNSGVGFTISSGVIENYLWTVTAADQEGGKYYTLKNVKTGAFLAVDKATFGASSIITAEADAVEAKNVIRFSFGAAANAAYEATVGTNLVPKGGAAANSLILADGSIIFGTDNSKKVVLYSVKPQSVTATTLNAAFGGAGFSFAPDGVEVEDNIFDQSIKAFDVADDIELEAGVRAIKAGTYFATSYPDELADANVIDQAAVEAGYFDACTFIAVSPTSNFKTDKLSQGSGAGFKFVTVKGDDLNTYISGDNLSSKEEIFVGNAAFTVTEPNKYAKPGKYTMSLSARVLADPKTTTNKDQNHAAKSIDVIATAIQDVNYITTTVSGEGSLFKVASTKLVKAVSLLKEEKAPSVFNIQFVSGKGTKDSEYNKYMGVAIASDGGTAFELVAQGSALAALNTPQYQFVISAIDTKTQTITFKNLETAVTFKSTLFETENEGEYKLVGVATAAGTVLSKVVVAKDDEKNYADPADLEGKVITLNTVTVDPFAGFAVKDQASEAVILKFAKSAALNAEKLYIGVDETTSTATALYDKESKAIKVKFIPVEEADEPKGTAQTYCYNKDGKVYTASQKMVTYYSYYAQIIDGEDNDSYLTIGSNTLDIEANKTIGGAGSPSTTFAIKENKDGSVSLFATDDFAKNDAKTVKSTNGTAISVDGIAYGVEKADAIKLYLVGEELGVSLEAEPRHAAFQSTTGGYISLNEKNEGIVAIKTAADADLTFWLDTADSKATVPSFYISRRAAKADDARLFMFNTADSVSTISGDENPAYVWYPGVNKVIFKAATLVNPDTLSTTVNGKAALVATSADQNKGILGGLNNFKYQILKVADTDNEYYIRNVDGDYLVSYNGLLTLGEKDNAIKVVLEAGESPVATDAITASTISVVAKDGAVIIKGAQGKKVAISNVLGQTIANTVITSSEATISAPAGIVVVAVEGEAAVKAIVK